MKKSLLAILSIPLVIGLASCGEKPHEHAFTQEWKSDASNHWHECSCGEKTAVASHTGGEATYEHGKICSVCNYEYTPKLSGDKLFDRTYSYNGIYTDFKYDQGTSKEDFDSTLLQFYHNETDLRGDVVKALGTVRTSAGDQGSKYLDGQIKFGPESKSNKSTFSGKEITTYDVNPTEGKRLAEFAIDPDNNAQYRMFEADPDNAGSVRYFRAVDHNLMSGVSKHILIEDAGMVASGYKLTFAYIVDFELADVHYKASFTLTYDDGEKQEVNITKQPKDCTVVSPDSAHFEIEVDHPELVSGYQWYAGAFDEFDKPVSMSPIYGSATNKRTLDLPGVGPKTGKFSIACLVKTKDREFFSDVAALNIVDARDATPTLFVLDYPIEAGSSFDLDTTPYGTGTISYSASGTEIKFENVHFDNKNIESNFEAIAFQMMSWHNVVREITFEFVGDNVINNEYWEDNHNQGGFGIFMHFAGESVSPIVNFKGDPLTIIGGTRAISIGARLNIYNDINVVGLPGRLTNGIYAYSIDVKSGANITGSLGGSILYTLSADHNNWGYINIEEGARVDVVINPGKVAVGDTVMFGIHALEEVKINKANVSLVMAANYERITEDGQMLIPFIGVNSSNSYIEIKNSNININLFATNVPETFNRLLANTVTGLHAFEVYLLNSNVNISAKSLAFANVTGIYDVLFTAENCQINIDVQGAYTVSGIVSALEARINDTHEEIFMGKCYGKDVISPLLTMGNPLFIDKPLEDTHYNALNGASFLSKCLIKNSRVLVNQYAQTVGYDDFGNAYYIDAGIRAMDLEVYFTDSMQYVEVHTNRASALVSAYDHVYTRPSELLPTSRLDSLLASTTSLPSDPYVSTTYYVSWNPEESKADFYVLCEALYEAERISIDDDTAYQTDIKLTQLLIG